MKNKILAVLTVLCLLFITGCDGNQTAVKKPQSTDASEKVQYVLALNPSVAMQDGTVDSLRNSTAKAISADVKTKNKTTLYDNSNWKWVSNDGAEWYKRLVRSLSLWKNGSGVAQKGTPYSYSVTDDGATSLAVFDTSKQKITGVNDATLSKSGVLMTFTGEDEEALAYTATQDCTVTFSDLDGGSIALVNSISGINTYSAKSDKSVLLKIYRNNRIYWQEILNAETPSVSFPQFTELELNAGDSMIISAQLVSSTDGIITGNCDLPATEKTITKKEEHKNTVLVGMKEPEDDKPISFVDDSGSAVFKIVQPSKKGSDALIALIDDFKLKIANLTGASHEYGNDTKAADPEEYEIYLYNTSYKESQAALTELKNARSYNEGDFIIRMAGKKLVIAALNEVSLKRAIDFFFNNYCKDMNSAVAKDLNYVSSKFNPIKEITLAGKSIRDYKIVVSNTASYMEVAAAEHLVKEITRITGAIIPIVNDSTASSSNEILVGDSKRANYRGLSNYNLVANNSVDNKYKITVSGSNTSILGSHIYGVNAGVMEFVKLMEKHINFANGYSYNGTYDGGYSLANGYKLVYADEFNGEKLSGTWSTHDEEWENQLGGISTNVKKAAYVKDGALVLETAVKENGVDADCAELYSDGPNRMRFQFGYVEIRFKMPTTTGISFEFWTQASVAGGFLESDICENFGDPTKIKSNLHIWSNDGHKNLLGGVDSTLNIAPGTTNPVPYGYEYHTMGWEWTPDTQKFFVDGKQTIFFDSSAGIYDVFDKPAWLILGCNLSDASYVGNNKVPANFVSDRTLIDYVHIYQQDMDGAVLYEKGK